MKVLRMKEPVNTLTHFIPFLAGIVGLVVLILESGSDLEKLITGTIFGVSIIVLYGASSIYHWIKTTPEKERLLRRIDHMAIFVLIAGSYTPILYFGLNGVWRWSMIISVWTIAFIGISIKIWFMHLPRWVSTAVYLGMGWLAVIPFIKLIENLPVQAIIMILVGGLSYTIGGVIYGTKKLNFIPNKFGFHEIFHIFVALGTTIHFFMVYLYII